MEFQDKKRNCGFYTAKVFGTILLLTSSACVSSELPGDFGTGLDDNLPVQSLPSIPLPFIQETSAVVPSEEEVDAVDASNAFFASNSKYYEIAFAVADRGVLSSRIELQGRRYESEAFRRTLLPQITPSVTTNQNGDILGRVLIEQIVFDSGRFRAGKKVLSAQKAAAFAEHVIQFNERVSNAVDAYLRSHRSDELSSISHSLAARYEKMLRKAQQRLSGGVGRKSELSLFDIKRLENVNEAASDRAVADAAMLELETLTGQRFEQQPTRFEFLENDRMPPVMALAIAEKKIAGARFRVEQADRLPEISLLGSVGAGTSFGGGFDDQANTLSAGVRLNQPLTWGKDYGLKSSKAQFRASQARVREQERDITAELKRLQLQAQSFQIQLVQSEALLKATQQRANEFEQQFLGGAVSIVEAVSILDAYKRAARMNIEMKYALMDAERQVAQIQGLFGPFKS